MQRLIYLFVLFLFAASVSAESYRIVHPDGSVEFSDSYQQGAEEIKLPKPQIYDVPRAAPSTVVKGDGGVSLKEEEKEKPIEYESVAVINPTNDQTVFFDTTGMPVGVRVMPPLDADHFVVISLDGREIVRGQTVIYILGNVDRGTHSLVASVVDKDGKTLKEGEAVTFHMRKHTVRK